MKTPYEWSKPKSEKVKEDKIEINDEESSPELNSNKLLFFTPYYQAVDEITKLIKDKIEGGGERNECIEEVFLQFKLNVLKNLPDKIKIRKKMIDRGE